MLMLMDLKQYIELYILCTFYVLKCYMCGRWKPNFNKHDKTVKGQT